MLTALDRSPGELRRRRASAWHARQARHSLAALVLAGMVLTAAPAVRADAAAEGADVVRARALFTEASRWYQRGDYERARQRFEAARRAHAYPELDFDVGRCLDRLGRADAAVAEYQRYLTAMPTADDAAAVRRRILVLAGKAASPAPTGANIAAADDDELAPALAWPAVATSTSANGGPRLRRWVAPLAVGGAALAVGVAGAGLVASVAPDYDRLRASCRAACQPAQWSGLAARADAGYALLGVAGALAIADAVLWAVAARRRERRAPRLEMGEAGAWTIARF